MLHPRRLGHSNTLQKEDLEMKPSTLAIVFACAVVLFVLSGGVLASDEKVTLVGTIVAADWDEDGNVVVIELETEDAIYELDLSQAGTALLGHVGDTVEVTGSLQEDEDGWEVLVVRSFSVVEESA
jgi:tRNA(Ile2) C34 agmatinyltransferase TiaS